MTPRPNGNRLKAVALYQQGLLVKQIAYELGLHQCTVQTYIQWGRKQKILPERKRGKAPSFMGLPPVINEWLQQITPEGGDVYDTIRGIVTDAYNEANS